MQANGPILNIEKARRIKAKVDQGYKVTVAAKGGPD